MKAVIEGKKYNTETAEQICTLPGGAYSHSDFRHHNTDLYRTKKGTFFVAGEGGPLTMWVETHGSSNRGGSGVRVVSTDEARKIMEEAGCDEDKFKGVGLEIEEG